jgi:hypothetical protein
MRFRVGCVSLLLLSGSGLGPAWAAPGVEPDAAATTPASERSVRVLILSHAEVDWAARVRGQLDDVDASVSVSAALPAGSLEAQVETARRLGAEHDADVVAWIAFAVQPSEGTTSLERAPGAYVLVWSAPTEQQYVRRLGEPWHQLSPADQSAALEIGALTVRSAVRSLAIDRTDEPRSEAALPPAPVEIAPSVTRELSAAWGWHAGASYGWQLDGQTAWGMSSLAARVGLQRDAWSTSLQAGWGLPATIDAPGAELELQRHVAWLEAAHAPVSLPTFSLQALMRVGVTLGRRETRPTSTDVLAAPPRTELSFCVGAGVRGALHVHGSHSLTLGIAATWLPAAPRYVVEDPANDRRFEYSLWNIQPSIELGWLFSR